MKAISRVLVATVAIAALVIAFWSLRRTARGVPSPDVALPAARVAVAAPAPVVLLEVPASHVASEPETREEVVGVAVDRFLRAGPYDPELETHEEWRLRMFRRLLAQFDGEPLDPPEWPGFDRQQLVTLVVLGAVMGQLESSGRAVPEGGNLVAEREARKAGYEYVMSANGFTYSFNAGEFPVYDEFRRLSKLDPQRQASFSEPEPPRTFIWPEEFFQSASEFAHETWKLQLGNK